MQIVLCEPAEHDLSEGRDDKADYLDWEAGFGGDFAGGVLGFEACAVPV